MCVGTRFYHIASRIKAYKKEIHKHGCGIHQMHMQKHIYVADAPGWWPGALLTRS